jgi:metal-dependent hydrolase (beta-lactamase superfamily II)
MGETVIITILVENTVHARGLLAEHGLSFHLQVGQHSLLFDTDQSDLFLHNALKLGLSLAGAEAIVLSHGHNDHTGGLRAAHQATPSSPEKFPGRTPLKTPAAPSSVIQPATIQIRCWTTRPFTLTPKTAW